MIATHTKKWIEKNFSNIHYDEIEGIKYPKKETIINLHDFLVEVFEKDNDSILTKEIMSDAILSFTGIKYYTPNKKNKKETVIFKGALIFNCFLELNHPFFDGNKRTGFVTLWLFLALNNINLTLPLSQYEKHITLFKKWADIGNKNNTKEIKIWLEKILINV